MFVPNFFAFVILVKYISAKDEACETEPCIVPCSKNDLVCVKKLGRTVVNGIPEFGIPSNDPFNIVQVMIYYKPHAVGNVNVSGLSSVSIDKFSKNNSKNAIDMLLSGTLNISAEVSEIGELSKLGNIEFTANVRCNIKYDVTVKVIEGKEHYVIHSLVITPEVIQPLENVTWVSSYDNPDPKLSNEFLVQLTENSVRVLAVSVMNNVQLLAKKLTRNQIFTDL